MFARWCRFMVALLLLTGALPGPAAAQVPNTELVLTVTGLDDNQRLSGAVTFNINAGPSAAYVYAFSNLLPVQDGTSYSWGQWSVRGRGAVRVKFDTRYLPDGAHAVTVYARDRLHRLIGVRSFSVAVQNYGVADSLPSHIEIEKPVHLEKLKGNAVEVKVRDYKTEQVSSYIYRVTPLGVPFAQDIISYENKVVLRGRRAGWYAVTAWAFDASGQAIDKSTVTIWFDPGK